ncbi:tetratricopeptide repeat protein 23-like [Acanthaster planci]|uniref:Tetratricopeptide repeat protein 23-like n=1 Tax=Acanthaster planci TaxID=133434 RepID=A0A8B7XYC2_ACAPL|nr:tetratricopeptide repeat protein 23-like [Acanthaster planci]XP_022084784.1 tetratricopeptide repeat protein 23-like [Acanthaster planci]
MESFSDLSLSDPDQEGSDGEEKPNMEGLGLQVVDIPTENGSQSSSTRRKKRAGGNGSNDNLSDDGSELSTQRLRGSPGHRKKKLHKLKMKDGSIIVLNPPEELLKRSETKARKHAGLGEVDPALEEYIRCTALCRLVYGDSHWKLAESHTNLAYAYLMLKGLAPQAQYQAEAAKKIMLSGLHASDSSNCKADLLAVLVKMYYVLGRSNTMLDKYPEAEQCLLKAEKVSEERAKLTSSVGSEQEQMAIYIAIAMGKLYANQNKQALGASYYEKGVRLTEKHHGTDSLELIPIYQDLGKLEQSKGRHANHDKAVEYYLQAHSITVAKYSGQSEEVAETAYKLALAYSEQASAEAETTAERYLDESLGIRQVLYGPHHPKTITTQECLCKLLIRTDRQEEAVSLLKTIISSKCATFGDFSEEVGETYRLYGSILLSQGQLDKAMKYFKKCYSIQSSLYGPSHKKSKATQQTIDMLLQSPTLKAKEKQSKAGKLKSRPRFSATVKSGNTMQ